MKHISCRFALNEPVMSVIYLSVLRDLVQAHGCELKGCKRVLGNLSDYRLRITPEQYLDVVYQTLRGQTMPGIGFQFGAQLSLAAAGPFGQLLMSTSTMQQAMEYFLEFYPLLSLSMQFESRMEPGSLDITVEQMYREQEPDAVRWFITESFFYCIQSAGRALSGEPLNYSRLEVCFDAPPHAELYEKKFGCPVVFGSDRFLMSIDRSSLKREVITRNQPVMLLKEHQCRQIMGRLGKRFSINEQIVTILKKSQPDIPALDKVADQLNISQSSLYRRLKEADTSYQKIVDNFREHQAIKYLRETDLPVCEVAANLGFSDPSNFRRAFKKWTGTTPAELRSKD
jgi:AraC-like DNA-binding protein